MRKGEMRQTVPSTVSSMRAPATGWPAMASKWVRRQKARYGCSAQVDTEVARHLTQLEDLAIQSCRNVRVRAPGRDGESGGLCDTRNTGTTKCCRACWSPAARARPTWSPTGCTLRSGRQRSTVGESDDPSHGS